MKRGFVTETHLVIYCEVCGDHYADDDGESICFDNRGQAVRHLAYDETTGWAYDGDTVRCRTCENAQQCRDYGHELVTDTLAADPVRVCSRCGLPDTELT